MSTPAEKVAEDIASAMEGRIVRIDAELAALKDALSRIPALEAERAEIVKELAIYQPRRPKPREIPPENPVDATVRPAKVAK